VANINQNRWDQLVRRVAGLIGPGSKVNNTIGDLFPMLDVENLPGELYLLAGTRLGYGGVLQVAAGGETARIQLFNPADSGMIITCTSVIISNLTTVVIRLVNRNVAESTNDLGVQLRDTRIDVGTRPTGQVRSASDVTVLAGTGEFRSLLNTPHTLSDPNGVMVLAPGTGLTVTSPNTGIQLSVMFFWRERAAEASELQF